MNCLIKVCLLHSVSSVTPPLLRLLDVQPLPTLHVHSNPKGSPVTSSNQVKREQCRLQTLTNRPTTHITGTHGTLLHPQATRGVLLKPQASQGVPQHPPAIRVHQGLQICLRAPTRTLIFKEVLCLWDTQTTWITIVPAPQQITPLKLDIPFMANTSLVISISFRMKILARTNQPLEIGIHPRRIYPPKWSTLPAQREL